ncbi:MAG: 50S ribosomal protein L15, partial [Roseiflexaceae bacterium]|nr:50S ribosomal protein L15 [Roseiflexaceae bacterium]
RGFNNKWAVKYQTLNVGDLTEWPENETVSVETLIATRTIKKNAPLKVLGDGEITTKLTVEAHKFSAGARQKIEAAGGICVDLPWAPVPRSRSRGPNMAMVNGNKGVRRKAKPA